MEIKLYNTLTRAKENFIPLQGNEVRIYSCGPTVYSYAHIGNFRTYIFMDTLRRMLEYNGFTLKHVMNITDVGHLESDGDEGEDKMEKAAKKENKDPYEIAKFYTEAFLRDMKKLNIEKPEIIAKATDHIPEMLEFVKEIIANGYAYETSKGIYFDISKLDKYPVLSNRNLDEQIAGARVDVDPEKRNPYDFAIWIKAPQNHIMKWDSPWGLSYPGWHIECSVMAKKYLADEIDIHAGGEDLIFPHHENEIAQSEAANGVPFAKYWMHNAFLNIDNKKMSKSLGNFFTVRDIAKEYDLQVLRFFMLSAHYRNPINFSHELMESAKNSLDRIVTSVMNLTHLEKTAADLPMTDEEQKVLDLTKDIYKKFEAAMDDDFNTADAISAVFELVKLANSNSSETDTKAYITALKESIVKLADILGLNVVKEEELLDEDVEALINERQQARKDRNFARADEIRDELTAKGIVLEDTREGVRWKRA